VKPIFSDDERTKAVKNFIVARYQGLAKIRDFQSMVPYLQNGRIIILCNLPKTGEYGSSRFYTSSDAERYFEWLVAVVTGAQASLEELVKQANDQLFQFINVLRDYIEMERNVQLVTPYDWQALFTSFDERLTEMQGIIDRGDKAITEVLNVLLQFVKKNTKLLDILYKENEKIFGKGKPS